MRKYRAITIIFLITFLGGAVFNFIRTIRTNDIRQQLAACQLIFPEAENFSKKTGAPLHYKVTQTNTTTGQEELVGLAFLTTDIVPQIRGYAGLIKIMTGIDLNGTIVGLNIVSHSETPSYVFRLDDFLHQFTGLHPQSTFKLGNGIDGISRATITSQAITQAVEQSLKQVARKILHINVAQEPEKKIPIPWGEIGIPLMIFLIAVSGIVWHKTFLRWIALISGLIYLGFIKSTMVSVVQVANIGLLKVPSFIHSPLWHLLIFLTLVTTFMFGMVYCGNVCPFGALQEIIYNISKRLKPKKILISREIDYKARLMKYGILITTVFISLLLGNASSAAIEPFLTFFTRNGDHLGWGFLIFILLASLLNFRFWCKYLCPIGALTGLFSRHSIFKIRLGDQCSSCEVCDKVCPTRAIDLDARHKPVIDYAECILCGKCIQKCPKQDLSI